MDAAEFHDKYGKEEAEKVSKSAGTSYAYFQQFITGNRRPSVELAQALIDASGGRLDLVGLLTKKRKVA